MIVVVHATAVVIDCQARFASNAHRAAINFRGHVSTSADHVIACPARARARKRRRNSIRARCERDCAINFTPHRIPSHRIASHRAIRPDDSHEDTRQNCSVRFISYRRGDDVSPRGSNDAGEFNGGTQRRKEKMDGGVCVCVCEALRAIARDRAVPP